MFTDTVAIIGNGLPSLVCSSSWRTACVQSYFLAQRSNVSWSEDSKKNLKMAILAMAIPCDPYSEGIMNKVYFSTLFCNEEIRLF